jgi:ribosomal protein S27AE
MIDILKPLHKKCKRCGYIWIARTLSPKVCPNCHCRFWERGTKKKKRIIKSVHKRITKRKKRIVKPIKQSTPIKLVFCPNCGYRTYMEKHSHLIACPKCGLAKFKICIAKEDKIILPQNDKPLMGRKSKRKNGTVALYIYPSYYNKNGQPANKPYPKYSKVLKRFIRNRDKVCQICGVDNHLDIHHKDGTGLHKTEPPNQSTDNLILLCHSCHLKLHNRINRICKAVITRIPQGKTYQSIAKAFNISEQEVNDIWQEYNRIGT